ncbi:MAG TPA: carbohydrate binding domain-containing protein, partial [Actinomycetota bacterium]|nr:carbohydrate binding domain-containing protein [Actinomycetota bacterium]
NGDFERGLGGWGALGGARIQRVAVAHSGAWAVRVGPAQGGAPARLGIASSLGVVAGPGRTYRGSAWVRASRPGTEVTLALREQAGDGQSSADVIGVNLPDGGWHEVAVVHQLQLAGARLSLELTGGSLSAGDLILVDEVGVTAP